MVLIYLNFYVMEIDAYVTPLVEKQQAYEKMVQKVSNIEEFNMIGNLVFE